MPPLNVRDLGDFIRDQRKIAQISLRQLARQAGVSNPYLSQIERGLRKPSAEILQQIAKALRISAEVLYVQAGILDERSSDNDVVVSILADTGLTERQKQVIIEIYDAFRKENSTCGLVPEPSSPDDLSTGQNAPEPVVGFDRVESSPNGAAQPGDTAVTTSSTAGGQAKRTTTRRKTASSRAAGDPEPRTPVARRPRSAETGGETGGNAGGRAPAKTGVTASEDVPLTTVAADEPTTHDPAEDA
ncbi:MULTISPECIES: helix-turn-helix domain-containing protein [unclassified Frankia]|uniref:helix-turn-helix domain-containing protein n=1 Tax=unclassified Frankia TaxID=2632575 RepID=UPI00272EB80A|nr:MULTISPECIES: helix-turn-helix transcriptional regulator [unclassified Frankia]